MLKVIIAGSRGFYDYELLKSVADICIGRDVINVEVISGTAMGADKLGEQYAKERGFKVMRFPALWNKYGKSAGFIRNTQMAKYATINKDDDSMLIAFWDGKSNGTRHIIKQAESNGMKVYVIKYKANDCRG